MKIKVEIKQVALETHIAEIDLSASPDRAWLGRWFDLYGNLLPDAENDPNFFLYLRDQIRLEFAGLEIQSEYVWDCKVLPETEAA